MHRDKLMETNSPISVLIRDACVADVPRLVKMGQRFIKESSYSKHLGDNPECAAELIKNLIGRNSLPIIERNNEIVGMLGFVLGPHFMSGDMVAGEVFWWVEPEYRRGGVMLMRETERRARLAGAKNIQMIAPNEKVARFYEGSGYEYVESTYQKEL